MGGVIAYLYFAVLLGMRQGSRLGGGARAASAPYPFEERVGDYAKCNQQAFPNGRQEHVPPAKHMRSIMARTKYAQMYAGMSRHYDSLLVQLL